MILTILKLHSGILLIVIKKEEIAEPQHEQFNFIFHLNS